MEGRHAGSRPVRRGAGSRCRGLHSEVEPGGDRRRLGVDALQRPQQPPHPRDGAADRHAGEREAHARRRRVRHRRHAAVRARPDRSERGRVQGRAQRGPACGRRRHRLQRRVRRCEVAQPRRDRARLPHRRRAHRCGPVRERPPGRVRRPTSSASARARRAGPATRSSSRSRATPAASTGAPTTRVRCRRRCSTSTARIACQAPPKRFSDAFKKVGKPQTHLVTIPSRINTAQFALTWTNSADKFTIGGFSVIRHGHVVAHSAKVRKLKVSRRRGATFTTVRVTGLVSGRLRFSVRASKLSAPGTPVSLTTQVTRRARR